MSTSKLSDRYWVRYLILIIIWILIIGVSLQGSQRLNDGIESSTNIISTDTPSYEAAELIDERFNGSGDQIQHIILLEVLDDNEKITDPKWGNYTLFLSVMLFNQMQGEGYDSFLSYPIIQNELSDLPNVDDIASELISDDESTTLVFLSSSTLSLEENDLEVSEHVHEIRDFMSDYDLIMETAVQLLLPDFGNDEILARSYLDLIMPSELEVSNNLNQILTGTPANIVDTLEVSEESFAQSEVIAAIVIVTILILVFRTPLGVIIPIISTVAALFPAYLITSFLGDFDLIVINSFLPAVIAMIGIAVAVDYNLFMLVRYREEFRKRRAKLEEEGNWNSETIKETQVLSSQVMNKTAGSAVMYSGGTVAIGFAALMLTENEFSVAMAVGVTVVVILSVITARTMTPAILAFTGRYLDWPNFMSRADKEVENFKKSEINLKGFWVKWSNRVMRRPWTFLLIGFLIMTPFVVLSFQTDLSFSLTKSLPAGTESREGFEIIQEKFDLGELNPYTIVIDSGIEDNSIWNGLLIDRVNSLSQEVLDYSGVFEAEDEELSFESVTSLSVLENSTTGEQISLSLPEIQGIYAQEDFDVVNVGGNITIVPNYLKALYVDHSKQYVNWDVANNTLLIEVTSNLDPGSGAAWSLVDVLRDMSDKYFGDLVSDGIIESFEVTGFTALVNDSSEGLYDRVPLMLTVAVILIFLALMVLFRSIILPIKAILTIGGSILFGLGTLVFVFQFGNIQLIELFGYTLWEAEVSGITYFLPTFLFTTILGLGMDYSIFILSRVREEYEKTGEMTESVGIGLAKTAGVVTSAATIMTLTFMVFALSPMLTLKMMGLAMAVAIVVDATIARTILLPAAMRLAGKYNFWLPEWLKKILPEIKLEH